MELFHQRIENTSRLIKSFKADQERLILKSRNEQSAKFKLTKANRVNSSRVSINEGSITNMLNTDCIIMPYCQEASSYKKLWPQSLIVNRTSNCAEVGQIESHGSLWKIVPCNDAAPGSRVMLQTSVSIGTTTILCLHLSPSDSLRMGHDNLLPSGKGRAAKVPGSRPGHCRTERSENLYILHILNLFLNSILS